MSFFNSHTLPREKIWKLSFTEKSTECKSKNGRDMYVCKLWVIQKMGSLKRFRTGFNMSFVSSQSSLARKKRPESVFLHLVIVKALYRKCSQKISHLQFLRVTDNYTHFPFPVPLVLPLPPSLPPSPEHDASTERASNGTSAWTCTELTCISAPSCSHTVTRICSRLTSPNTRSDSTPAAFPCLGSEA